MKNLILILLLIGTFSAVNASNYRLDQEALETSFEQSEDVTEQINLLLEGKFIPSLAPADNSGKSQTTAAIIAFAVTVAGGPVSGIIFQVLTIATGGIGAFIFWPILLAPLIPYHRLYLGTDGNGFKVSALYCVTLGWCGVLPIIDGVMLLVDDTDNKYIGNPKYLMWAGE